jgi:hypothetical protein
MEIAALEDEVKRAEERKTVTVVTPQPATATAQTDSELLGTSVAKVLGDAAMLLSNVTLEDMRFSGRRGRPPGPPPGMTAADGGRGAGAGGGGGAGAGQATRTNPARGAGASGTSSSQRQHPQPRTAPQGNARRDRRHRRLRVRCRNRRHPLALRRSPGHAGPPGSLRSCSHRPERADGRDDALTDLAPIQRAS